jgi:glyoxylase-like metal-dependent hydrolase (beta-lactamase superfamily II)
METTNDETAGPVFDRVDSDPHNKAMPVQSVGRATVSKVFELDGLLLPFSVMFPTVTQEDIDSAGSWMPDPLIGSTVAESMTNFSWHTYVIRFGEYTVLVDTGHGNDKERPEFIPQGSISTDFLRELSNAGIDAESVTHVLCTHMHYDHVGWNTRLQDGVWVATFPNARHILPRADFDFQSEHHLADPTCGPSFRESVQPLIELGLIDLVDDGDTIIHEDGVQLWIEGAPGHSPGNSIYHLASEDGHAVFCGDVVHHPLQLVRRDLALAFEENMEMTVEARARLLANVADRPILVFPAHFNGTSGGWVLSDPKTGGYKWSAIPAGTAAG